MLLAAKGSLALASTKSKGTGAFLYLLKDFKSIDNGNYFLGFLGCRGLELDFSKFKNLPFLLYFKKS
jgi:hypothetical protein